MAKCAKIECDLPFSDLSLIRASSEFCNHQYHTSCTSVSRQLDALLASEKNVLWFCDHSIVHKNGKIWALCNEIQKSRLENRSMLEDIY
jgi:hypothetical protein